MDQDAFEIQILVDSRCILRRQNEDWEREFRSIQEALDFAQRLPGGKDGNLTVFGEKGVRLARVVL